MISASSPYNGFEYWIYHNRFPTKNNVKTILEDVRSFLNLFPNEVVFVDFHEFPSGFKNSSAFLGLEKLVLEILGQYHALDCTCDRVHGDDSRMRRRAAETEFKAFWDASD